LPHSAEVMTMSEFMGPDFSMIELNANTKECFI